MRRNGLWPLAESAQSVASTRCIANVYCQRQRVVGLSASAYELRVHLTSAPTNTISAVCVREQGTSESVGEWVEMLARHCELDSVLLAIVGNKSDLDDRQITPQRASVLRDAFHFRSFLFLFYFSLLLK